MIIKYQKIWILLSCQQEQIKEIKFIFLIKIEGKLAHCIKLVLTNKINTTNLTIIIIFLIVKKKILIVIYISKKLKVLEFPILKISNLT